MENFNAEMLAVLQEISGKLNNLATSREVITVGTTKTPYLERTYTIAAGAFEDIYEVYNYFRVLSMSGSTLSIKVGDNGIESPYTGTGIGVDFTETFGRLRLINTGGGALVITIALADGKISDDRLTASGTVTVSPIGAATFTTAADVAVGAGATVQIMAANTSRREAFISNLAVNNTVIRVGDSAAAAAEGLEVGIGGMAIIDTQAAIYVYNPSAGAINIGNGFTA